MFSTTVLLSLWLKSKFQENAHPNRKTHLISETNSNTNKKRDLISVTTHFDSEAQKFPDWLMDSSSYYNIKETYDDIKPTSELLSTYKNIKTKLENITNRQEPPPLNFKFHIESTFSEVPEEYIVNEELFPKDNIIEIFSEKVVASPSLDLLD